MEKINLSNYKESRFPTAVALGNFDGIHIGHRSLIETMVEESRRLNLKPSLLLFSNHTRSLVDKHTPRSIISMDQKLEILEGLGVELVYIMEFDRDLMSLSPADFVEKILIDRMNTKLIVVGFDYRFGHKASGDTKDLEELSKNFHYHLKVINPIKDGETVVSSSKIRELIREGRVEEAERSLGRPYTIIGKVIAGESRGTKLGFPTANIELGDNYVLPKTGVYYSHTKVDGKTYKSATNIGYNPTFNNNKTIKIETYILDFQGDIYGKTIEVSFKKFLRDDIKFNQVSDLISQMEADVKAIQMED